MLENPSQEEVRNLYREGVTDVLLAEGIAVYRALGSSKLGGPDEVGEDFVANRTLMFCFESSDKSDMSYQI